MKILFVDIDGPLIPGRAFDYAAQELLHGTYWLPDPVAMFYINDLCSRHKVTLVVSSSWRIRGEAFLMNWFDSFGVSMWHFHKDWVTPYMGTRTEEVLTWIADHSTVVKWMALDDLDLEIPEEHMCLVSGRDGLLANHMEQMETYFADKA